MENNELIKIVEELRVLPKENEWVEFKTGNATTNERVGQYISAISNAACIHHQPFGYLVFGVDDNTHELKGTSFKFKNKKEGNQELELWIRSLIQPSVKFQFYPCQHGKYYLEVFIIPAAIGEPTHFKKIPYIRFDSSLTDLRNFPQHIRAIYNSHEDWSAKIIEKATIYDLDETAITEARKKFKEKKEGSAIINEIDGWSNKTFLDKAKITIDGKITNAAIILLGKQESAHFISPAVAQITWKLDTEETAYEHFEIPFFTSVNLLLSRIRNVKHKFFPNNQLIATEVLKYDTEVILEALNNCIAHQDYGAHSRIVLTEQTGKLIFTNVGSFFEGKADDYSLGSKTPKKYRNKWLVDAMVNLNMIDSLGFGIHKMYKSQCQRFFPLPDFSASSKHEVVLEIFGHSIDENYSKLLIERKDNLTLTEVILLDKVQKTKPITDDAAKMLKKKGYIEGRKPNFFIAANIAAATNQKAEYTLNKGLDKDMLKAFILKHIELHGFATRQEIDKLLMDNLPTYMNEKQRKKKIDNLLQEMKKTMIKNTGIKTFPKWTKINEE